MTSSNGNPTHTSIVSVVADWVAVRFVGIWINAFHSVDKAIQHCSRLAVASDQVGVSVLWQAKGRVAMSRFHDAWSG